MLSFLRAVGANNTRLFKNGVSINRFIGNSPSAGLISLNGNEPWNSAEEGYLVVRGTSTDLSASSGAQYLLDMNNGGSSPSVGIRIDDSDDDARPRYRDDGGNISSEALDAARVIANIPRSFGISWNNTNGTMIVACGGVAEEFTFTPNSATFANSGFSRLYVGSRNGNNEPLTGSVDAFEIGDQALSMGALGVRMKHDDMFVIIGAGQSLMRGHWSSQESGTDDGYAKLLEVASSSLSGQEIIAIDGSTSGSALTNRSISDNYWWNEDTDTPGPAYTNWLNAARALNLDIDWCFWAQGEGDAGKIDLIDEISRSEYKALLLKVFTQMRSDISNTMRIGIQGIGRRESGHSNIGGIQAIREIQQELASEHSWIHMLGYTHHADLHDGLHMDNTHYEIIAETIMRRALEIDGETISGSTIGPQITSASRSGTSVTVNITHDAGTDFTPTSGIVGFRYFDDGAEISISSAVRSNANTITLTLSSTPSGTEMLYYCYDDATDITDANISSVVKDNSAQTLPLVPAKITVS